MTSAYIIITFNNNTFIIKSRAKLNTNMKDKGIITTFKISFLPHYRNPESLNSMT